MTEDDIRLKLLANVPIHIDGIGDFQLPSVREVIRMNESTYQQYLSWILFSKDHLQSPSEDINEYTDMEVFVTLIFHDVSFREGVFSAFKTFLNSEPQMLENGVIYFNELNDDSVLTEEKWEYIKKLIRIGNYIEDKKEEYDFANDKVRSFWEKKKQKKRELAAKVKKEEVINLHSIISAVGWKANSFFNVLNLTIYTLYDAYYRLGLIDNYNHTMTGIYTGNVDGSKIKLPEINWANIIKLN